jgi:hypothetical protein
VCDNYEKFFDTIYTFTPSKDSPEGNTHSPNGEWSIRWMYADREPETYSYEKAMADAQIMFTG